LTIEDQFDPKGDVVIDTQGVRLVLSREQQDALDGTVIDYRSGAMGTGFVFHQPDGR
jgi:Fe-S cluster assembly iron-binding protein IscA